MNKKLKSKWVAALRSGKFKQGRSALYERGRYCCLGVLAEIQGFDFRACDTSKVDFTTETLPLGCNAGLTKKQRNILAAMNDGSVDSDGKTYERHSFKQIASNIVKNL